MVPPPAGCPDTVATLTWLKTSTTSTDIFARAPLVMSVRNTGPGYLLSSADDDAHAISFDRLSLTSAAHIRAGRCPLPRRASEGRRWGRQTGRRPAADR